MNQKNAKPFLKWAGGKTQLITEIEKYFPPSLTNRKFVYVEPFVGSGAVLFWILNHFPQLEKAVINDINADLIDTYQTIKSAPEALISLLEVIQDEYHSLDGSDEQKKAYYYEKRSLFNKREQNRTTHSALFIFLNRTCFNGLYRVNRKNEYNVPIGSYKKPTICDKSNLLAVSEALQKVELLYGDFEQTIDHTSENTLFYLDPPYKPLSETSSFNSYAKGAFNDEEQIRLKQFCDKLNSSGHSWLLSNSDVKGQNATDNFFDDLYADFTIKRVTAKRIINALPKRRGCLKELLITNQHV
ncbi:MAG: DNA adenine methylase [Prevotellaceae bacterium]|nr:DNA adenine methylase [Prevotellaceae bacterium]